MTSYQKRKEDIQRLNQEKTNAIKEFTVVKHILLAIARGQKDHAKMTLNHFEKVNYSGCYVSENEIEEIKSLIEKM
jgi:histidinol dehydrogenase